MSTLGAGVWLLGCWLAAGMDARHIKATLWLAQCTQADLLGKFTSVYSLAHGMAFPCSFLLMMLMSAWHIGKSQRTSRTGAFISTALMWLSMYPVCLISEPIALRAPGSAGVQIYAFLMLAVGSATMLLFNHKNLFPKRGYR
ncbi:MAG TPA: hypothetical protein VKZ94_13175 [Advenella sp.]|nr:hypothetical protein [Advenella sp.]